MEIIKNLITRLRRTGVLFLIGFLVIIYIAFGFLYWQQGAQQRELEKQIVSMGAVVARPLPSSEKLRADYEEVDHFLAPKTDQDTIAMLVRIAEENGIDIDPDAGKFLVPSATFSETKVGGGSYQLLSFRNIRVQADYENVMAFISDLDSGKTLETMVLKSVSTSEVEVKWVGEEGDRRAEFRKVVAAVMDMMIDNGLSEIPKPMNYSGGVAANLTGDDPDTEGTVEGFPDITTTAADKGYSGNVTPRVGYVLYNHDKIDPDDTTNYDTVSYINMLTTKYYYTCEADGTVRQFDGANVVIATEYLGSEETKTETVTNVNVDIYTKLEE